MQNKLHSWSNSSPQRVYHVQVSGEEQAYNPHKKHLCFLISFLCVSTERPDQSHARGIWWAGSLVVTKTPVDNKLVVLHVAGIDFQMKIPSSQLCGGQLAFNPSLSLWLEFKLCMHLSKRGPVIMPTISASERQHQRLETARWKSYIYILLRLLGMRHLMAFSRSLFRTEIKFLLQDVKPVTSTLR